MNNPGLLTITKNRYVFECAPRKRSMLSFAIKNDGNPFAKKFEEIDKTDFSDRKKNRLKRKLITKEIKSTIMDMDFFNKVGEGKSGVYEYKPGLVMLVKDRSKIHSPILRHTYRVGYWIRKNLGLFAFLDPTKLGTITKTQPVKKEALTKQQTFLTYLNGGKTVHLHLGAELPDELEKIIDETKSQLTEGQTLKIKTPTKHVDSLLAKGFRYHLPFTTHEDLILSAEGVKKELKALKNVLNLRKNLLKDQELKPIIDKLKNEESLLLKEKMLLLKAVVINSDDLIPHLENIFSDKEKILLFEKILQDLIKPKQGNVKTKRKPEKQPKPALNTNDFSQNRYNAKMRDIEKRSYKLLFTNSHFTKNFIKIASLYKPEEKKKLLGLASLTEKPIEGSKYNLLPTKFKWFLAGKMTNKLNELQTQLQLSERLKVLDKRGVKEKLALFLNGDAEELMNNISYVKAADNIIIDKAKLATLLKDAFDNPEALTLDRAAQVSATDAYFSLPLDMAA